MSSAATLTASERISPAEATQLRLQNELLLRRLHAEKEHNRLLQERLDILQDEQIILRQKVEHADRKGTASTVADSHASDDVPLQSTFGSTEMSYDYRSSGDVAHAKQPRRGVGDSLGHKHGMLDSSSEVPLRPPQQSHVEPTPSGERAVGSGTTRTGAASQLEDDDGTDLDQGLESLDVGDSSVAPATSMTSEATGKESEDRDRGRKSMDTDDGPVTVGDSQADSLQSAEPRTQDVAASAESAESATSAESAASAESVPNSAAAAAGSHSTPRRDDEKPDSASGDRPHHQHQQHHQHMRSPPRSSHGDMRGSTESRVATDRAREALSAYVSRHSDAFRSEVEFFYQEYGFKRSGELMADGDDVLEFLEHMKLGREEHSISADDLDFFVGSLEDRKNNVREGQLLELIVPLATPVPTTTAAEGKSEQQQPDQAAGVTAAATAVPEQQTVSHQEQQPEPQEEEQPQPQKKKRFGFFGLGKKKNNSDSSAPAESPQHQQPPQQEPERQASSTAAAPMDHGPPGPVGPAGADDATSGADRSGGGGGSSDSGHDSSTLPATDPRARPALLQQPPVPRNQATTGQNAHVAAAIEHDDSADYSEDDSENGHEGGHDARPSTGERESSASSNTGGDTPGSSPAEAEGSSGTQKKKGGWKFWSRKNKQSQPAPAPIATADAAAAPATESGSGAAEGSENP